MANDGRVAFDVVFSTGYGSVYVRSAAYEKPMTHLCYAGTGCQGGRDVVDRLHEQMSCPGACLNRDHDNASAWQAISAPIRISEQISESIVTILRKKFIDPFVNRRNGDGGNQPELTDVVELRPTRDGNRDCMKINVCNSMRMGAQAVFTLACDTLDGGERGNYSAGTDPRPLCPKNDRVSVKR